MNRGSPTLALACVVGALALIALAHLDRGRPHAEAAPSAPTQAVSSEGAARLRDGAPLDLNTATEAELELLPRIGPALAARIVESRTQEGRFRTVDDLGRVRGIGPRTIASLRRLVAVTGTTLAPDGGGS